MHSYLTSNCTNACIHKRLLRPYIPTIEWRTDAMNKPTVFVFHTASSFLAFDVLKGVYTTGKTFSIEEQGKPDVLIPITYDHSLYDYEVYLLNYHFVHVTALKGEPVHINVSHDFEIPLYYTHLTGEQTLVRCMPKKAEYVIHQDLVNDVPQLFGMICASFTPFKLYIQQLTERFYNIGAQSTFEIRKADSVQHTEFFHMIDELYGAGACARYYDATIYVPTSIYTAARYYDIDVREFGDDLDIYAKMLNKGNVYTSVTAANTRILYIVDN